MDKIKKLSFLLIGWVILQACSGQGKEQRIIDRAIETHGGNTYKESNISFDFRDIHYQILKMPSRFEYSREFTDSLGVLVKDILNNDGFVRYKDGKEVAVTEERKQAYTNSVNSVAYFAFLPYGLNDPAARKEWKGETELEGQTYDIIEVTFDEEGGGDDFEDEFLYWFNRETGQMDYLAYTYHTEGGGVRFRKAFNSRLVNGIRIQDYENYMPEDKETPIGEMEALYKTRKLKLLSTIVVENVLVEKIE